MEDPALGEAVKYDAALQTINPDPVYPAGAAQPGDNGVRARRRSSAIAPTRSSRSRSMQTSTGGGASGGSSGPR